MCHYLYPVSIIHKDNDYELISGSVLSQAADSWRVQFSYITSTHFIHLESVLKTTKTSAGSQYFNLFFRHWNVTQKLENEIIKTFTLVGCSSYWKHPSSEPEKRLYLIILRIIFHARTVAVFVSASDITDDESAL